jgi:hypothetical protein
MQAFETMGYSGQELITFIKVWHHQEDLFEQTSLAQI